MCSSASPMARQRKASSESVDFSNAIHSHFAHFTVQFNVGRLSLFFLYIFLSPHALASCWVGIVVDTEKCSSPRWQIWALSVASPPAQNLPTLNVFGANK